MCMWWLGGQLCSSHYFLKIYYYYYYYYYCYYFKFYYFNCVCSHESMSVAVRREQRHWIPSAQSGFWGLNSGPLEDQQVPLTTELSLHFTLLVSMHVWQVCPSRSLSPVFIKSCLILCIGINFCFQISRISDWVQILRHLRAKA